MRISLYPRKRQCAAQAALAQLFRASLHAAKAAAGVLTMLEKKSADSIPQRVIARRRREEIARITRR
jgi:hypothetical protein